MTHKPGTSNIEAVIQHPIEIDPVIDETAWEQFSLDAVNGTIFHSLKFLSYHPPERFNHHHVMLRRKGNIVGIFPGVILDNDGVKTWVSHQGASYGGLAYSPKLRYHHVDDSIRALVDYARKIGIKRIRMTPPPVIYNRYAEQPLEFALWRHGFKAVRRELTQVVPLDFDEEQLVSGFVNKTRTAYRKAVNMGLKFRIIETPTKAELDRFWEILKVNRAGLGVVPTHNRAEIERLHELIPDNLMMAVIEYKGRIIAEIWNFICNRDTVLEFYMAHEVEHQALRPVPFLTYHTLIWAQRAGYKFLDFGISSINGDPTWGLLKFKENFGARHYFRLTYQVDL